MIGRALSVVLLVSVQLGGVGCTREHPQPRARSAAGSPAAAKKSVAVAQQQRNRASPSAWTDPASAPATSSSAPVRKTALAHPPQPGPMIPQDETLYPARTPDGRQPLWRQRASNY